MTTVPEIVREASKLSYGSWGVSSYFESADQSGMDADGLVQILDATAPLIASRGCRVSPSSFDSASDQLRAFPRESALRLPSIERALRDAHASGVISRVPLFWQMALPLHAACRANGIPIYLNEPENMPVGAMALESGDLDAVVTDNEHAAAFSSHIAAHAIPRPRLWVIIHHADEAAWDAPGGILDSSAATVQEVHVLPGIPMLVQCEALASAKARSYHAADEFFIEFGDSGTHVSGIGGPLPLYRYNVAADLRHAGTCSCGKETLERI